MREMILERIQDIEAKFRFAADILLICTIMGDEKGRRLAGLAMVEADQILAIYEDLLQLLYPSPTRYFRWNGKLWVTVSEDNWPYEPPFLFFRRI